MSVKQWKSGRFLSLSKKIRNSIAPFHHRSNRKGSMQNQKGVAEYISASTLVHCFDGWSYLGRAIEAELAGDPDSARHLGYYAALRAAISILASEGVGVFQNQHFVVLKPDKCLFVDCSWGTHEFVWKAFQYLMNPSNNDSNVFNTITPGGVSMSTWFQLMSPESNRPAVELFSKMVVDLSKLANIDRFARNEASYRPTAFFSAGPKKLKHTIDSIGSIWKMCEPKYGPFPNLDLNILRRSIVKKFELKVRKGKKPSRKIMTSIKSKISVMLDELPSLGNREFWEESLSFDNLMKVEPMMNDVEGNNDVTHIDHSKQVLARATLLLRIATGSAANLLKPIRDDDPAVLDFWITSPSVIRRLYPELVLPNDKTVLWTDIEDALLDITQWTADNEKKVDHYTLWTDKSFSAARLSTIERVFLWGVGI